MYTYIEREQDKEREKDRVRETMGSEAEKGEGWV